MECFITVTGETLEAFYIVTLYYSLFSVLNSFSCYFLWFFVFPSCSIFLPSLSIYLLSVLMPFFSLHACLSVLGVNSLALYKLR